MDPITFWGWAINGHGGVVNIIERLAQEHPQTTPHFVDLLEQQIDRLLAVHSRLTKLPEE